MISMTKTSLGTPRCPEGAYLGSEAQVMFGGTGVLWFGQQHSRSFLRLVDLIPSVPAATGTRVSAVPERSP